MVAMISPRLTDTIALLSRTPAALDVLLRQLPDMWTTGREGDDSWNAREIVGHLAHCERTDWLPRVRLILRAGESETFARVDRGGFAATIEGRALGDLLDEFARLRAANLDELRGLEIGDADFERRGRHPAFGAVTLAQLLATWAAHDLTHLHQISRVLAHQYRDAVGPWRAYLGVLHCDGHSGT